MNSTTIKILLFFLTFFIPTFSNSTTILKEPENQVLLKSIDDLKNKRIAVLLGSAHEIYATEHFPDAQILQYKSPADVYLAVKTQKADAGLYDNESLRELFRKDDSLALLGESLFSLNVGVGFNKKNNELKDKFNIFLTQIKASNIYEDMENRWMIKGEITMPMIPTPAKKGILVVGVSDAGMPITIVKDNELVGFDIELARRFAAFLGKEIKFLNMDFGSLIAAVSSEKVDMIASGIYVTDERKKQIDFSDPYYAMDTRVFALKENILERKSSETDSKFLTKLSDIKDKKIAVMLGSAHDTFAQKHFPQAQILQYKSISDVLLAVKTHKVDVGFYSSVSLVEILKTNSDIGVIGEPFEMMPVAFGFSKDNVELHQKFNEFFKFIQSNGIYEEIINRWTKQENPIMPKIETQNINGMLIAGHISDGGLPFVAVKENENIGLNIELAKRFAAYLGKDIRFDDMEFGSLIPAVSTGKIDFIAVSLMVTEERKQKINFAEPYYEIGMSVFALRENIADTDNAQVASQPPSFLQGVINSFHSNIIEEKRYLLLLDGLETTILLSVLSAIFGTLLGGVICFMRMSKLGVINISAKIYISILRGIPVLVLLMLMFYIVFGSASINPIIVATIAFGMNFSAYVAEIYRSGIESIDKGQVEAGIAMGFNKIRTFIYIILPQTIHRILPVYKGEFISLVKMTSIVGYIAVQDLTKASDIIRSRTFDAFFPLIMVAILYFLISWLLMQSLNYVEKISDPKHKRQIIKKS